MPHLCRGFPKVMHQWADILGERDMVTHVVIEVGTVQHVLGMTVVVLEMLVLALVLFQLHVPTDVVVHLHAMNVGRELGWGHIHDSHALCSEQYSE